MSAAENQAVHAAAWGEPEVLAREIDAGNLVPDHFTDPLRRAVIEAVLELVGEGTTPTPAAIHDHLVGIGWTTDVAVTAVLLPGTFEPWTGQSWRLPLYLAEVAEDHRRRELNALLTRLAARINTPGGPERLAAELGVTV